MPTPHDMLFRTLADPTRRAIFERLCRDGEQTVGALTARAKGSQPAGSKHLGLPPQAADLKPPRPAEAGRAGARPAGWAADALQRAARRPGAVARLDQPHDRL